MTFVVRQMSASDRACWADMRCALWPDHSRDAHLSDIDGMLDSEHSWAFVIQAADGAPAGFAELALRPYANGCDSRPVPFLEGIWIEPSFRRHGLGAQLVQHIAQFIKARGYRELASDALIDNQASLDAHRAWGFSEMERVVCFRKFVD
jgi:aminoglycoside 6'-N-acetyltransferase I